VRTLFAGLLALGVMHCRLAAGADWGFDATAGAGYDDNLSNGFASADRKGAASLTLDLAGGLHQQLGSSTALSVAALAEAAVFDRYSGLNRVGLGGRAQLRHKFGLGALAPWISVAARGCTKRQRRGPGKLLFELCRHQHRLPLLMKILLLVCAATAAAGVTCVPGVGAAQIAATVTAQAQPVADTVVVAVPEGGVRGMDRPPQAVVDQLNKEFVPYVTAILVGSLVQFPSRDHIRHHVYSFSPVKPFELPLYAGTPAKPGLFDKPGVVKLGCNIHDWMIGYIYVAESPYFAKTGPDGRALLVDLPAGRYRLRAWHPRMQGSEQAKAKRIEVTADASAGVSWELALKPEFRPRRAPLPGDPG
jgi:hypothetical protein